MDFKVEVKPFKKHLVDVSVIYLSSYTETFINKMSYIL